MKATILYSLLFVTAITLIATADYSDMDIRQKKSTMLTLRSAAAVQDIQPLYSVRYTVDPDSTLTQLP